MHTTTQPNHTQIAIHALHRLYRETNTLGLIRKIPLDVAALRLQAYADLIALLEGRVGWGTDIKIMTEALNDWEDHTYEDRAILTKAQQTLERKSIQYVKQLYLSQSTR